MERQYQVASAVRRALVMGALTAAGATPALAQENLGEIVVTGSRIRSANLESTTPVTQVTAADVVTQGVTRIEDLVNQLPQAFAAQNVTLSNAATGTATLNLRGLGSPRTLVLIDGRRMPYGGVTSASAAPDINQIPTQMIERVDILTGGASAVYGSDAVAGVVNFIMKKDFEGVQVTSQYNFYWHENDYGGPGDVKLRDTIAGLEAVNPAQYALPDDSVTDGEGKELSLMVGVNSGDGRGNLTAYATVFDSEQVLQRDRDYSACSLDTDPPTEQFLCGGSATSAGGLFTDFSTFYLTLDTADSFRDFEDPADLYNFGPLNHFQRPERRYSIGAMGHYEFGEHADVYTQLMFNDYESVAQIAPSGNFFDTGTINCNNPFLPANSLATIGCGPGEIAAGTDVPFYIGRRNVEGGGRQQSFANSSFRAVAGVRGAINDAWGYDASAQYSNVSVNANTLNYFVVNRLQRALDVVRRRRRADLPVRDRRHRCGLRPLEPVPAGRHHPGRAELSPGHRHPDRPHQPGDLQCRDQRRPRGVRHQVAARLGRHSARVRHRMAPGHAAEHRRRAADGGSARGFWRPDHRHQRRHPGRRAVLRGPRADRPGPCRHGEPVVRHRVPLLGLRRRRADRHLQVRPRVGAHPGRSLARQLPEGGPCSQHRRAVHGAGLQPVRHGRGPLRRGQSRCRRRATRNASRRASPRARSGQTRSTARPASISSSRAATPDLTPEESDTYSYGVVFTPRFAPGLAITVDYFDIKIDDTISTFGSENSLNACYVNNDPAACARINRNANGQLWVGSGSVVDLNINIGSVETKGWDLNASYTGLEMGRFGSLNFNLTGTLVEELITDPGPGLDSYDCVGILLVGLQQQLGGRADAGMASSRSARAGSRRGISTCRSPGVT